MSVLLLLRIDIRESIESRKYAFLQYMDVKCLVETVDEILGCVCLEYSTDDEVVHSLRTNIDILQ